MASFNVPIDYDALAAAILRQQVQTPVTTHAEGSKRPSAQRGAVPQRATSNSVSSVGSWADAVEEEEEMKVKGKEGVVDDASSSASVEMPAGRPSSSLGARVVFGGLSDGYEGVAVTKTPSQEPGYFRTVVRNANAVALRAKLESVIGHKIPKVAHESLALCTYTAGVMPISVVKGKDRVRTLAAVGDAALTMAVVVKEWSMGNTVESCQSARTRLTNNRYLCDIMKQHGYIDFITYAPGVDPLTTTGTATAFEAILGVLVLYRDQSCVNAFLRHVGLI